MEDVECAFFHTNHKSAHIEHARSGTLKVSIKEQFARTLPWTVAPSIKVQKKRTHFGIIVFRTFFLIEKCRAFWFLISQKRL